MEKEQLLKDIEQLLSEKAAAKDFSDEAIANITKVFHEAIREKNSEYGEQIEKAKAEQAEAETQKDELSKTLSELQEKLNSTEEKLQGLEEEKVASQTQTAFDARMSYIEELYELEDADRKVIASEVSELSLEEEAFASYQEKLAVVLKSKSKEYLSKLAEEMESRIQAEVEKRLSEASETVSEETASVESQVEETLDKAEAVEANIPNNNGESIETEESLQDRFVKAFKDSVKVTF
jgi:colicin import membrane protein